MATEPDTTPDNAASDSAASAVPADDAAALQARIATLEKELVETRERADRYHANWQRSAADFQNWKRRTDQEKTELTRTAEGAMTLEMVRVLDDFERAFMALPPELRNLTWIEGVYMIGQKLYALLQARGLSPINAQGEEFDPFLHEAVLRDEGADGNDNLMVVQELQRGYRFHDRVIRPTMVKVGSPASPAPEATDTVTADSTPVDTAPVDTAPESETASGSDTPVAS